MLIVAFPKHGCLFDNRWYRGQGRMRELKTANLKKPFP
jgi:hypothetical protein